MAKPRKKLPAGGIPHVQKGMFVWMVAQSDGLLCPDLWDFTRRDVRDKAARNKGRSWQRLEADGWASHRVYIATIPRGFKVDVRLHVAQ